MSVWSYDSTGESELWPILYTYAEHLSIFVKSHSERQKSGAPFAVGSQGLPSCTWLMTRFLSLSVQPKLGDLYQSSVLKRWLFRAKTRTWKKLEIRKDLKQSTTVKVSFFFPRWFFYVLFSVLFPAAKKVGKKLPMCPSLLFFLSKRGKKEEGLCYPSWLFIRKSKKGLSPCGCHP